MHSSSTARIIAALVVLSMVTCAFIASVSDADEEQTTEYRFCLANTVTGEDSTINGWYTATGSTVVEAFCNALDEANITYTGFTSTDKSIFFSNSKTISNWTTSWDSTGAEYLGANYAVWNYNETKGWYLGNTFGTDSDTVYYISHESYLNVDGSVAASFGIDNSKVWPAAEDYDLIYDGTTGGYANGTQALIAWYKESYGMDDVADYGLSLDETSEDYDDADEASIYWMMDIDMSKYTAPAGWDISGAQYGYAQMAPLDKSASPDDFVLGPKYRSYMGATSKFTSGTGTVTHTSGWDKASYDSNAQTAITMTVTGIPSGTTSSWTACGTMTVTSITFKENSSLVYIPSYVIFDKSVYFKVTSISDEVIDAINERGMSVVLPQALRNVEFGDDVTVVTESTYTDTAGNVVTYLIDETTAIHSNGYAAYTLYGYATEKADAKYCEQGTVVYVEFAEGQTEITTNLVTWSKNPMVSSDNMISGSWADMIGTVVTVPKNYGIGTVFTSVTGTGKITHTSGWDKASYDANSQVTAKYTVTELPRFDASNWNDCGSVILSDVTFKDNSTLIYIPSYVIYKVTINKVVYNVFYKVVGISDEALSAINERGISVVLPQALRGIEFGDDVTIVNETTYTDTYGNVVTYRIDETGAVYYNGYMTYTVYGYATENADARYCEQGTVIDVQFAEGATTFSTGIVTWAKNPMVSSDTFVSGSWADMIGAVVTVPKDYALGITYKFTSGTGKVTHTNGWDRASYDTNSQTTITFTTTSLPRYDCSDWDECGTVEVTDIVFKANASLVYIPSYVIYKTTQNGTTYYLFYKVVGISDAVIDAINERGMNVVLPQALRDIEFGDNVTIVTEASYTDNAGNVVTYRIDETGPTYYNGYMAYTLYGYATSNADARYCEQGTVIAVQYAEGEISFSTSLVTWAKSPMVSSDNMISGSWADMIGTVITDIDIYDDKGMCGDAVEWKYYDGTLTISGDGAMFDKSSSSKFFYFKYRADITSVVIEGNVTHIGNYAFSFFYNLENVTIGDSVVSIGKDAFNKCRSLSEVTIGENATEIDSKAFHCVYFYYADGSKVPLSDYAGSEFIGEDAILYTYTANGEAGESAVWELDFETGILTVSGEGAMYDLSKVTKAGYYKFKASVTEVVIDEGITYVGANTFYGFKLDSIIIGDDVVAIGNYAFWKVYDVHEVVIGDGLETLGYHVFSTKMYNEKGKALYSASKIAGHTFIDGQMVVEA